MSIRTDEGTELLRACKAVQSKVVGVVAAQMQVICPVGSSPGALIQVNTPDGQQLQVQVPQGVVPGRPFTINIPTPPGDGSPASLPVAAPATAAATTATTFQPPTQRQLKVFAKATVRESVNVNSPEVGALAVGEIVPLLEEGTDSGHLRVRVGMGRWISRVTKQNHVLAYEPATLGVQLQLVETATVRSSRSVQSAKLDELSAGKFVMVEEECECDGHVRVRIAAQQGQARWISRVTASGKPLAELHA